MNRNAYRLVAVRAPGLVTLFGAYGTALWALSTSRKHGKCHITDKSFKSGAKVFRPMTNGYDRMVRITESGMKKIIARAALNPTE